MSLKVWLPLNGTLDNRGLNGVEYSSISGTVSYTTGKVGQAMSCNGSTYCVFNGINLGSEATICCWAKTSTSSKMTWVLECTASDRLNLYTNTFYTLNTGDSNDNPFKDGGGNTIAAITDGAWHHFAVTFGNNMAKLYIDGQYRGTALTFRSPACTNGKLKLAGGYNNGHSYDWNGAIDDFRIYDHCLSEREVKDVSQGLLLHYTLEMEPKNLVPFLLTSDNYTITDYQGRTPGTISDFVYHVDGYQLTPVLDTWYQIKSNSSVTLPSSSTVYLSFYCKCKSDTSLFFGTSGYSGITRLIDSSNNNYFPQSQVTIGTEYDGLVVLPITTGSDTQYKIQIGMDTPNLSGEGSFIDISQIMISKEQPTHYVQYTETNVVYDSSGYRNDGSVNGTIAPVDDSPRYVGSTSFNGTSYIQLTSPSTEVRTISLWVKWNTIPSGQSVVFVDQKSKIGFGLMSTGILCSTNSVSTYTFPKTGIVANQWYHFAIVNTSSTPTATTRDLYINGVKQTATSSTSNWTYALDYLQLGKRSTTSDGFAGKLSDFRMYATALSAEDIMDLYSTSAYVHNTGTMSCFAMNESSENLLKYENTVLYTNPANTDTRGKYTTRNGEAAMLFRATDTYYGASDERNSKLLYGFFKENTSYVFDLWMDMDDVIYQDVNRLGGFTIIYTDGTTETTFQLTGSTNPYTGWQHRVLVTNPNKTVKSISIYYWTNSLFYVRADSFIVECSQTDIKENGVVDSGNFIENTDVANIGKATFNTNKIIEI